MPLNNQPSQSYLSAGAFALLPYESMASKHQARQSEMQYGAMLLQSMQQQAAAVKQSEAERQQLWNTIASADVLQPDKARLKAITDDFRARMEKTIREEFKGDGRRFERERQDQLLSQFREEFINSPVLNKALSNKTNYALYQAEKAKNKLAMPIGYTQDDKGEIVGYTPYESQIQDFMTGKSDSISQPEMIEYPKDVLEKFSKEYKPGAQFGYYNPETKQYEAPLVSAEEIRQSVINKGYDPQKAYFLTKFMLSDQVGKLRWKTEQQAPWELEQMRHNRNMDLQRLSLSQYNAKTSRMGVNISAERLKMEKAEKQGVTGAFDLATAKPYQNILPNQDPGFIMFPGKPNPNGGNGVTGIATAINKSMLEPIKDIFGFSEKPKKVELRTPGVISTNDFTVESIGAVNEIVSPNTGDSFKGNYTVSELGQTVFYREEPDPQNPGKKIGHHYISAKVLIDDDTAFKQNIKQNFGVWDQATTAFQGRNNEAQGGGFFGTNDLGEYEVYIPIPRTAILNYQLDKGTLPKGALPYLQEDQRNRGPQDRALENMNKNFK